MLPKINTYSFWVPLSVTLPTTGDLYKATIPLKEPREFLLDELGIMYPAIGAAAPTTFRRLKFNITDLRRKYTRFYEPITVTNYSTPGLYENFALNSRPRNQQWLYGRTLNMLFAKRNSVQIEITGFQGVGNPLTVELVLYGNYFLGKSEIITDV